MDDQVVRDLVEMGRFLGSLDGVGVRAVKATKPSRVPPSGPSLTVRAGSGRSSEPAGRVSVSEPRVIAAVRPDQDIAAAQAALTAIRDDIGECRRCRLCDGRTKIVFGQGSPAAELMFVGEAPGADEDASGLAFVGRAGQFLTDMIEKGMKIQRAHVFIANVIKCRPPGNRPPESDEVATCQPFLEAQIKAIKPRAIVALGATAGKFMTKSGDPISRLRGRFSSWDGIPVMPTYHPAYLLRNPAAKKTVWEDLKLVLDRLGNRSE